MAITDTSQPRGGVGMSDPTSTHDKRWWILAVLGVAQLMVILDTTIVNIALPAIQRDLHASLSLCPPPSTRCTSPTQTGSGS